MRESILLRISGKDKPGVTAFITAILAKEGASILDVGQSVLHENLSLGILIELPESAKKRLTPVRAFSQKGRDRRADFQKINRKKKGK